VPLFADETKLSHAAELLLNRFTVIIGLNETKN